MFSNKNIFVIVYFCHYYEFTTIDPNLHVRQTDLSFNNFSELHATLDLYLSLSLSGVRQALWLTKTKLTSGLPPQLLSLAENPANQIPDQDERVQNAIKHARFWDTTEERPDKDKYR